MRFHSEPSNSSLAVFTDIMVFQCFEIEYQSHDVYKQGPSFTFFTLHIMIWIYIWMGKSYRSVHLL